MKGIISLALVGSVIPFIIGVRISKRYKVKFRILFLGFLTFFLSQIIFRIPILNFLKSKYPLISYNIYFYIFLAITAGLVEVLADYIVFKFIEKKLDITKCIIIGIGHAICENIYFLISILGSGFIDNISYLASFERLFAIVIHIACGLFAYYSIKKKQIRYLVYGILVHALDDLIIFLSVTIVIKEVIMAIISIVALVFILNKINNEGLLKVK